MRGLYRLIWIDTLRRVRNIGFLAGRLMYGLLILFEALSMCVRVLENHKRSLLNIYHFISIDKQALTMYINFSVFKAYSIAKINVLQHIAIFVKEFQTHDLIFDCLDQMTPRTARLLIPQKICYCL